MKRIRPPASAVAVVVISLLSPQSAHGFHARQPLSSLHRLAGEHQLSQAPAVPSRTLSRSSALKLRRGTRKYDDIGDDEANYYRRKRLGYRSRGAALFGWLPSISVQQFLVAANMTFFALQIASAVSYGPVLNAVLLDSGYSGPTLTGKGNEPQQSPPPRGQGINNGRVRVERCLRTAGSSRRLSW